MFARLPDHGAYGAARLVLIAYGALVIGLVDNLLRPFQIGIDTRLPDYVVLLSTLGGIAIFGLNGLVFGPVIRMFIVAWEFLRAKKHRVRDQKDSRLRQAYGHEADKSRRVPAPAAERCLSRRPIQVASRGKTQTISSPFPSWQP